MKSKIIIFLVLIVVISFLYGILVGHYQIFPYSILSEMKNTQSELESDSRVQIHQDIFSIENLISFENVSDIETTKQDLIEYIWNDSKLPKNSVQIHEININDPISSKLQNLERIDSFTVEMDYGVNSISYLFLAKNTNDKLIIFHQGHHTISLNGFDNHSFDQDISLIQNFLDDDYSVLIFSMPGKGMNNEPIINHEKFGTLKLNSHDHFELLESENKIDLLFWYNSS